MIEHISHPSDTFRKHWETILSRDGAPKELSIDFLPELNNKIWGLKKKKLVVVGARPSMGKSSLLLQMAHSFALQGKNVFFFSFEMSKEVCVERLFSCACEVDNWKMTTGKIAKEAKGAIFNAKLTNFYSKLEKTNFVLVESIGRNLPHLSKITTMFPFKPDVVFIDYGNMVDTETRKTKKESIDEYIKGLRALAIHNDFCAIMAAQINRKTHDKKAKEPQLWELKDSGNLEETADMVLLLHWPYWYDREIIAVNDYRIDIAKNRDGRTGYKKVLFYPEWSKFKEDANT